LNVFWRNRCTETNPAWSRRDHDDWFKAWFGLYSANQIAWEFAEEHLNNRALIRLVNVPVSTVVQSVEFLGRQARQVALAARVVQTMDMKEQTELLLLNVEADRRYPAYHWSSDGIEGTETWGVRDDAAVFRMDPVDQLRWLFVFWLQVTTSAGGLRMKVKRVDADALRDAKEYFTWACEKAFS
jgi:hypothetical protein